MNWDVYALRYGENTARTRRDSFPFDPDPDAPHPMDFYFWVLRRGAEVIVVDTGMSSAEATRRGRSVFEEPPAMLARLGIDLAQVTRVILTHLHFDHAGALEAYPNARLEVQAAELRFATSAHMANPVLRMPYTADHVTEVVRRLHDGQVTVHDGDAQLAEGLQAHLIGGHSEGLMALTVQTHRGRLVLASDVAHYFESIDSGALFAIVSDPKAMARGLDWLRSFPRDRVIPGHDPALRKLYSQIAPEVYDLSAPIQEA
ncbi:N-acyl homoserine lactonase family protein [Marivita sp. S0852]|uniref:N-acyl homoserine lactonase family protein n=1 Tax=Marivita sp. S0852 TaxID=3373893 RepID=UPI0039823F26